MYMMTVTNANSTALWGALDLNLNMSPKEVSKYFKST